MAKQYLAAVTLLLLSACAEPHGSATLTAVRVDKSPTAESESSTRLSLPARIGDDAHGRIKRVALAVERQQALA